MDSAVYMDEVSEKSVVKDGLSEQSLKHAVYYFELLTTISVIYSSIGNG